MIQHSSHVFFLSSPFPPTVPPLVGRRGVFSLSDELSPDTREPFIQDASYLDTTSARTACVILSELLPKPPPPSTHTFIPRRLQTKKRANKGFVSSR